MEREVQFIDLALPAVEDVDIAREWLNDEYLADERCATPSLAELYAELSVID